MPVAGLFSGFLAGGLGYDLFTFYKWSKESSLKRDAVLAARHMPLWSNLRNAVNPDRAFFELADERHNEPLVFHSGLYPFIYEELPSQQQESSLIKYWERYLRNPTAPSHMGTTDEKTFN